MVNVESLIAELPSLPSLPDAGTHKLCGSIYSLHLMLCGIIYTEAVLG